MGREDLGATHRASSSYISRDGPSDLCDPERISDQNVMSSYSNGAIVVHKIKLRDSS